jgi:hypothetical protein
MRHGMELTRIPKSIRQIKLKDFDAYGGNIQTCVQAMAKQRIAQNDPEGHAKKRLVSRISVLCSFSLKRLLLGNGKQRS